MSLVAIIIFSVTMNGILTLYIPLHHVIELNASSVSVDVDDEKGLLDAMFVNVLLTLDG